MARPAHTPGPWEFVVEGGWPMIYSAARDEDGDRLPVADLFHGGYDFADIGYPLAVNARLIAAAPELLAVAEAVLRIDRVAAAHGLAPLIAQARAALSKAGALPEPSRPSSEPEDRPAHTQDCSFWNGSPCECRKPTSAA